jgi:hypothetical protein
MFMSFPFVWWAALCPVRSEEGVNGVENRFAIALYQGKSAFTQAPKAQVAIFLIAIF